MNACTLHSSTQSVILVWFSVIRRAFCDVAYTCMMLIFYSTPAVFFFDATVSVYDNSTVLEPRYC